ncbi:unnamed protein product [Psylliodes chrysocephalus]|uniref:Regulatory protein zeste n=1 Tax=Psylliodes chrysocephalus TaxID=3402493 RepID=A0A9P0GKU4_9CUCU|nr:unnamed protein product [Psylliodes chrysocephala]
MTQCLWEQLTLILNSVDDGARKNCKQWRKTWQDMKKNVKSKITKLRIHSSATGGGGPSAIKFDETDSEILRFMSESVIYGQSDIEESNATFDFNDIPTKNNCEVEE